MKEYIIGVDIGGTNLRAALINSELEIVRRETALTERFGNAQLFMKQICSMVEKVNYDRKADTIGIVLPVPWIKRKHIISDAVTIPYLENISFSEIRNTFTEYRVYFENDVNVIAFLEANAGEARKYKNSIYVTVSTGIGSGIIINNKIYHGSHGYAGELGCIPVYHPEKGVVMFEELCSGTALTAESIRIYGEDATAKLLFNNYLQGDLQAIRVINRWKEQFSVGLAAALLMFDPDIIILGGPVIVNNRWIVEQLVSCTKEKVLDNLAEEVKVVLSKFGVDAGLIGAGYYAFKQLEGD